MRAIAPRLVGLENDEITIGEEQLEFKPITVVVVAAITGDFYTCCRYTLDDEERERVAKGEDLFLMFVNNQGLPAHHLRVGPPELIHPGDPGYDEYIGDHD